MHGRRAHTLRKALAGLTGLIGIATAGSAFATEPSPLAGGDRAVPFDSRGDLGIRGRVPWVFVRHLRDGIIPLALQDRMIREADERTPRNRFRVFDVGTAHVPTSAKLGELLDLYDRLARPLLRD
ncbi:hypothetical protein [Amycolatopsis sp. NPDC051071]|uniref:hypothetical protein n=1 Tax=Amycolatopsis sp. NPDC051071 TaxID=3154637 RepID=UPI0034381090